jgi:alpha-galactosidase
VARVELGNERVRLVVGTEPDGDAWLQSYLPSDVPVAGWQPAVQLPLVELTTVDSGRRGLSTGLRKADGSVSHRLRLRGHDVVRHGSCQELVLSMADADTGLAVAYALSLHDDEATVRAQVTVTNSGTEPQLLTSVSTFAMTGFAHLTPSARPWAHNLHAWVPYSGWLSECRWRRHALEHLGVAEVVSSDHDLPGCMRRHVVSNTGTWSSSDYLPMGVLEDAAAGVLWAWEIAHNGSWSWELGDRERDVYLTIAGPCDVLHQWRKELAPGESFTGVPAAVTAVHGGFSEAIGALTETRRRTRLRHRDNAEMKVVYNDWFNIWGDPTTEKLLPVIAAAADVGAEVFCVDAGWHGEVEDWTEPTEPVMGIPWWDAVGDWSPARNRFTGGLTAVLDAIRERGMVPGLWMEPEVVGVRSPILNELPPEALFRRHGHVIQDRGRYQLDFRHPAVTSRLDAAVDALVVEHGIGYLKLDYNIEGGTGTEVGADSPGDGLLQHNRAVLRWLQALRRRHPDLVVEGCASGGNRLDQAMLALVPMQSTSDQKDPLLYAAVSANARSAVPAEQCGCWAIPEPKHGPDELAVAMCNALLGRVLLSGRLQSLAPEQLDLVRAAIAVYKGIRHDLGRSLPLWPCGVPGWSDEWLVAGARVPQRVLLTVWNRSAGPGQVTVPGAGLQLDAPWRTRVLFSSTESTATTQDTADGVVVRFPGGPTACVLEVVPGQSGTAAHAGPAASGVRP